MSNYNCKYCALNKRCKNRPYTDECTKNRNEYYTQLDPVARESLIEEGYKNLAAEIVSEAVKDKALNKVRNGICSEHELSLVVTFLQSSWCYNLSGLDYKRLCELAERLRKELGLNGNEEENN